MRDFAAELEERKQAGLYRTRRQISGPQQPALVSDGVPLLSFCSNDYLGLANHPGIIKAATEAMPNTGFGGAASHLICGHHDAHHQLELRLAEFTRRSAALFFSTGYMANMGVISALAGRGDTIFSDRLNHASIIDGCVLSRARVRRYRHGDMSALADMLAATGGHKLVVTDGVFSMDGDIAPLRELAALCRAHEALLVVDDAHGLGVLGPQGRGSLMEQGLSEEDVPILIGTLGKAVGTSGAFVAGPQILGEAIDNLCREYIYSTALPLATVNLVQSNLKKVQSQPWRREKLGELIRHFQAGCRQRDIAVMPSQTAIQPVLCQDSAAALALSQRLLEAGFFCPAIRPPTVPKNQARLRVTLSATHTTAQINQLLAALQKIQSLS